MMDTNKIIEEHSKIKLKLYELYLERYLSVLMSVSNFNQINVIDLFAGCGISDNNEDGSALIAANVITKILIKQVDPKKKINLLLNEKNNENCLRLEENIKNYKFASVERNSADEFIKKWKPGPNLHNLFFIDPYGYTQINPENLRNLFKKQKCDFLIFIPIYHIYRFLKKSEKSLDIEELPQFEGFEKDKKKRKKVNKERYYEPIQEFLGGLEIDKNSAIKIHKVEEFAELIKDALKRTSSSDFVYCQIIRNKENNNKYSLFFISHHILGAEKFLEAQNKLGEIIKGMEKQFSIDLPDQSIDFNFIELNKPYNNVELYKLAVSKGIFPRLLADRIRELEKLNNGDITISALGGRNRRNQGLYIDYKHYKEKDYIISVTLSEIRHVAIID